MRNRQPFTGSTSLEISDFLPSTRLDRFEMAKTEDRSLLQIARVIVAYRDEHDVASPEYTKFDEWQSGFGSQISEDEFETVLSMLETGEIDESLARQVSYAQ